MESCLVINVSSWQGHLRPNHRHRGSRRTAQSNSSQYEDSAVDRKVNTKLVADHGGHPHLFAPPADSARRLSRGSGRTREPQGRSAVLDRHHQPSQSKHRHKKKRSLRTIGGISRHLSGARRQNARSHLNACSPLTINWNANKIENDGRDTKEPLQVDLHAPPNEEHSKSDLTAIPRSAPVKLSNWSSSASRRQDQDLSRRPHAAPAEIQKRTARPSKS